MFTIFKNRTRKNAKCFFFTNCFTLFRPSGMPNWFPVIKVTIQMHKTNKCLRIFLIILPLPISLTVLFVLVSNNLLFFFSLNAAIQLALTDWYSVILVSVVLIAID